MSRTILRLYVLTVLTVVVLLSNPSPVIAKVKPKLTMDQARTIATKKAVGEVKSQELEEEKGRLIYSFDIQVNQQIHEVNVDANSGEIVDDTVEDAASEAKEKAQDAKDRAKRHASAHGTAAKPNKSSF